MILLLATVYLAHDLGHILLVVIINHGIEQDVYLFAVDESHPVGDFFDTGNLLSLPSFDSGLRPTPSIPFSFFPLHADVVENSTSKGRTGN